jgi:hypothetical protein
MSELSVHDNIVIGYAVSCEAREIVMHTIYHDGETVEKTDIVFRSVEAYHLAGDDMNSVLFDVEKGPIDVVLEKYAPEFERGVKYNWPGAWNDSPETCREHFATRECGAWMIASSCGIDGFVIARSMELVCID